MQEMDSAVTMICEYFVNEIRRLEAVIDDKNATIIFVAKQLNELKEQIAREAEAKETVEG